MRDKYMETHEDDGMRHAGLISTSEERRIENMEAALHAYRKDAEKYKKLYSDAHSRIQQLEEALGKVQYEFAYGLYKEAKKTVNAALSPPQQEEG